jgi:hypothetical protein
VLHIVCVCVCNLSYAAYNVHAPYFHLWPARFYSIFARYLINGMIFRKKVIEHKMLVLIFSTTCVRNVSHSQINEPDISINAHRSSCKVLRWSSG